MIVANKQYGDAEDQLVVLRLNTFLALLAEVKNNEESWRKYVQQQLPSITGEFGVVQEPDLRWNDSGRPWVKVRGAAKSRKYDKDTSEWVDGARCTSTFSSAARWLSIVTESVTVGDAITVSGRLGYSEWTDKDGGKRHSYQILADYIGVSVRFGPQKSARLESGMKQSPATAAYYSQDGQEARAEQEPPF